MREIDVQYAWWLRYHSICFIFNCRIGFYLSLWSYLFCPSYVFMLLFYTTKLRTVSLEDFFFLNTVKNSEIIDFNARTKQLRNTFEGLEKWCIGLRAAVWNPLSYNKAALEPWLLHCCSSLMIICLEKQWKMIHTMLFPVTHMGDLVGVSGCWP